MAILAIPGSIGKVVVKLYFGTSHVGEETSIAGDLLQALLSDGSQHQHRVMAARFPQIAIESAKQIFNFDVPVPVEVIGKFP
jgi:hypothetical protein